MCTKLSPENPMRPSNSTSFHFQTSSTSISHSLTQLHHEQSHRPLFSTTLPSESPTKSDSFSYKTYSDLSETPTEMLRRGHDFAPSSSLISGASSSWGEMDNDFDKQAALTVQKALDKLDSYLFNRTLDGDSNEKDEDALYEECLDWSSNFPHLRISGVQVLQIQDSGVEAISTQKARAMSPYFFSVPQSTNEAVRKANPSRSLSSATLRTEPLENSLVIEGIRTGAVIRETTLVKKAAADGSENDGSCGMSCAGLESTLDWSEVLESLKSLREWKSAKSTKINWILLACHHNSTTTTGPSATSNEQKVQENNEKKSCISKKQVPIHTLRSGIGNLEDFLNQAKQAYTDNKDKSQLYGIIVEEKQILKDSCKTLNGFYSTIQYVSEQVRRNGNLDINVSSGKEIKPVRTMVDPFDVWKEIGDVELPVYIFLYKDIHSEVSPTFTTQFTLSSVYHFLEQDLIEGECLNGEDIFAVNGSQDEYFALDQYELDEKITRKQLEHCKNGLPPVTPVANVRQTILDEVFDDIWSELVSYMQPAVDFLVHQERLGLASTDISHRHQLPRGIDSSNFSAMTIRSIPLVKRTSSARIKHMQDHFPTTPYYPTMDYSFNSTRPTSSQRSQGMEGCYQPTYHTPRTRNIASAWKRNNPSMRLEPLQASSKETNSTREGGIASNLGWESSSRPSTSIPYSGALLKKLPPLRPPTSGNPQPEDSGIKLATYGKHVLFDDSVAIDSTMNYDGHNRVTLNSKRQTSAGLRARVSRPYSTMDDSRFFLGKTLRPSSKNSHSQTLVALTEEFGGMVITPAIVNNVVKTFNTDQSKSIPPSSLQRRKGTPAAL